MLCATPSARSGSSRARRRSARAAGPARARRLVVERRPGHRPRRPAATRASWRPQLVEHLNAEPPAHVERVEIAGPGFVNFHLRDTWLHDVLRRRRRRRRRRLRPPRPRHGGERVQIEFVSANPTGPVHVGNGWFASYGDALGRLLERCGHDVQPRVLRERHRRADPPPRGERAGPGQGRAGARGRLPERVRQGTGLGLRGPRRRRPRPAGGRPSASSASSATRWRRCTSTTTSGSARRRSRTARPWPRRSPSCAAKGLVFERGRRHAGCARPTSAIPGRSGSCARPTATTPTWPATSPTTATSS